MAINYNPVGWDSTKFFNPTNMNQMDNGIKSACDGVDDIGNFKKGAVNLFGEDLLSLELPQGFYFCNSDVLNKPNLSNGYAEIIALNGESYRKIKYYRVDSNETWINTCNNGTWSGWKKFAMTDYPKQYTVTGFLFNSPNDSIKGYGVADVTLEASGLVRVDYTIKIDEPYTNGNEFTIGLNRDLIRNLNSEIPMFTPIVGGCVNYYNSNGALSDDETGFGGFNLVDGQFWKPSRVYTTNGDVGSWSAKHFPVGTRLVGTCYGAFTP